MRIIAKFGVELNGHIYRKGEVCEYAGTVTQRIADNFTDEHGDKLAVDGKQEKQKEKKTDTADAEKTKSDEVKAKIAKTVEVMKREGIIQALDGMGITYSPKSKTDYLAKLLLMSKGEIEE